jgi:hypothetical protein
MKLSRLILNGINGRYPREICDNALPDCELVEAAVAYVSQENLVFEWCWKNEVPLKFWGRFDETVPVGPRILKLFLDRRSPNFVCKLLTHFHAKVVWWHGVGAYIGSANLSDPAWYGNIEAGCFFEETDMIASGMDIELRAFFQAVDVRASPLTEELYKAIETRQKELNDIAERDREQRKRFTATPYIRPWSGLVSVARKTATTRRKDEFLKEWLETLQILRDIGTRISADENRPKWLTAEIPSGAQADQFLHAHYYHHVIDEQGRSRFAEQYEKNKHDPERALRGAIAWWRDLPNPPSKEDRMLYDWAPVLRRELSEDRILALSENEFDGVCERVWSIQDHGRRVRNDTLNLPDGFRHSMAVKTKALAHYLFKRHAPNGSTVLETLHHVLYGGSFDEVPLRLWDAMGDGPWRIEHLGVSALGEIIGWALPDRFPPRNNRTSKSLRSLGFDVSAFD